MKTLILSLFFSTFIFGQNIFVPLDSLSTLDDHDIHVTLLSDQPQGKIVTPPVVPNNAKYFTLFYNSKRSNDPNISVLIDQQKDQDVLYVDKNDNKNLTDDGDPVAFLHSQNMQYLDIHNETDTNQIVRLVIYRVAPIIDSLKNKFFDNDGNLIPEFVKFWGSAIGNFEFKGNKGAFFCDDRVTLRRGKVELDGVKYDIGLFDYSNNGLYNDDDDLLIIDLNKDGKLLLRDQSEVFKLNDVFKIGDSNYELSYIDKYGKNLSLTKTSKTPTNYFLQYWQNASSKNQKNVLTDDFWKTVFTSMDGKKIVVNDFKGKYILLNAWGEWCKACQMEIPELKEAFDKWKEKVVFLSLINTLNIEKVKEFVSKEKISWPQIIMDTEVENRLKITSYPTNILIFPDGKTYLQEGQINRTFFDLNIK